MPFQPGFPLPLKRFQKQGADLIPPKVTALFKRNSFPIEIASQRVYPTLRRTYNKDKSSCMQKPSSSAPFFPPLSLTLSIFSPNFILFPPQLSSLHFYYPGGGGGGLYCRRRSNDSILPAPPLPPSNVKRGRNAPRGVIQQEEQTAVGIFFKSQLILLLGRARSAKACCILSDSNISFCSRHPRHSPAENSCEIFPRKTHAQHLLSCPPSYFSAPPTSDVFAKEGHEHNGGGHSK